jgi:hypothetical protein
VRLGQSRLYPGHDWDCAHSTDCDQGPASTPGVAVHFLAHQQTEPDAEHHHDVPVEFAHTSLPTPVPADVALCLFRVTEESLNNVARHSHAKAARVDVSGAPDGIHLTVRDDGKGFDTTQLQSRAGLGFVSMQERLRLLRGTVRIDSALSHGTTVNVWIPSEQMFAITNQVAFALLRRRVCGEFDQALLDRHSSSRVHAFHRLVDGVKAKPLSQKSHR